ncbi:MAG: hypothetical protein MZV70_58855 [Desulfobacterales bacterium]|nr:hypothetical protein [Desulfobacterales bacterium]
MDVTLKTTEKPWKNILRVGFGLTYDFEGGRLDFSILFDSHHEADYRPRRRVEEPDPDQARARPALYRVLSAPRSRPFFSLCLPARVA